MNNSYSNYTMDYVRNAVVLYHRVIVRREGQFRLGNLVAQDLLVLF